jgi:hypothetical protein
MTSQDRFTARRLSEEDIARRAGGYRKKFGISDTLCVNIIEILEFEVKNFIPDFKLMIRRDIELDTTAYTSFDPPRIFVRETIYDSALEGDVDARHILAHELGHLLLHSHLGGSMQRDVTGYDSQFSRMSLLESSEAQADSFARNFLLAPHFAYGGRADVGGLSREAMIPLAVAKMAVKISKRQEMWALRAQPKSDSRQ